MHTKGTGGHPPHLYYIRRATQKSSFIYVTNRPKVGRFRTPKNKVYQMSTARPRNPLQANGYRKQEKYAVYQKSTTGTFQPNSPPAFPQFHPQFLPFPQRSGGSHAPDAWFFRPKY